jgi:hypothetical protein
MRYALLLAEAGPESNKAGPLGLLTIVLLGVAVYFLYRSMVRHLNKVPDSFDDQPPGGVAPRASTEGTNGTDRPAEPPTA